MKFTIYKKVFVCLFMILCTAIYMRKPTIPPDRKDFHSEIKTAKNSALLQPRKTSTSMSPVASHNKTAEHNRSSKFMTIDRLSMMCNNMHEYATLRGLAAMTGHKPVLSSEFNTLARVFHLQIPILPSDKLKKNNFTVYKELWGTPCANTTILDVTKMGDVNIRLHGWFESYRYFEEINDVIRAEFTFNDRIKAAVVRFFNMHVHDTYPNNTITIGIHIRQGDKATGKNRLVKNGWILPPISYFNKAMDYFRSKYHTVVFIFCTDDVKWVEKTFVNNTTSDVVISRDNPGHVDLAILSSCDHVIISRGTYSWWAGWLTAGTTIYYKYYHPNGSLGAAYHPEWSYIPKDDKNNWIALAH